MKNSFALIFFELTASIAIAQVQNIGDRWIVVGVRGTVNSTWLYNSNQWNDKGLTYKPTWGGSGGIMLGFHYATWGSINAEVLYSTFNQKTSSGIDSIKWTNTTKLSYLEFPILLHFDTRSFKYFEAGIKISSLLSAQGSYNSPQFSLLDYSNKDIKDNFQRSNLSLILGWGGAIWGSGGLLIHGGFRLTYGLSDIISLHGGKGDSYQPLSDLTTPPKSYAKTNTASIGFNISMDYDLGWIMSSSCNRKYKFFLFSH